MNGFLLDTNVISEIIKPKPAASVSAWVEAVPETLLHLSVLTLGEIRKGIEGLTNAPRRIQLQIWFERDLIARFQGRMLPIDLDISQRWGELAGRAALRGAPMPVIDGLLAATSLHHNLTLVTRDTGHLEAAGVSFFNPWAA